MHVAKDGRTKKRDENRQRSHPLRCLSGTMSGETVQTFSLHQPTHGLQPPDTAQPRALLCQSRCRTEGKDLKVHENHDPNVDLTQVINQSKTNDQST